MSGFFFMIYVIFFMKNVVFSSRPVDNFLVVSTVFQRPFLLGM